jgi:hypothetical protein
MAVGLPAKTTYADGDVFSSSDINDTNGTLNLVGQTTNFYAGKNKIINGDFAINQRSFTSTTTTATFGFDRFILSATDGTSTYSAETFTPGAAPVAGYESTNFARLVSTGQTLTTALTSINQKIEDVRTFAGQTVTVSFWAKASTGTPSVAASLWQEFGIGASATTQQGSKIEITSSWARYSVTISLPSVSGKTIVSNSALRLFLITSAGSTRDAYTGSLGIQSVTIDFWGVQVEAGLVATAFQTATGTLQGELAACQRYYWRGTGSATVATHALGFAYATTGAQFALQVPVTMRIYPTSIDYSNIRVNDNVSPVNITGLTLSGDGGNNNTVNLIATVASGLTQFRGYLLAGANASNSIGLSAEF